MVYDETLAEPTASAASAHTGTYRISGGSALHVSEQAGRLYLQESGQDAIEMFPIAGGRYCFTQLERHIRFEGDVNSKTQTLILEDLHGKNPVVAKRE